MKQLLFLLLAYNAGFADIQDISSFEADFTQSVTDEKNKVLQYTGHVIAQKPQDALWDYITPIDKKIYLNNDSVTIIEPELEQVIIKHIQSNFDFFSMIRDSKKVTENKYEAYYRESKFIITTKDNLVKSISYIDEFENNVKIVFKNQEQNKELDKSAFLPLIPIDFDIIRD